MLSSLFLQQTKPQKHGTYDKPGVEGYRLAQTIVAAHDAEPLAQRVAMVLRGVAPLLEVGQHGMGVDQPKVAADNPGDTDYSTEQQWINNMGRMPVMPKYKRVAVITKDSYGEEHINELGWIEIDSNGYLKYTKKTGIN